MQQWSHYLHASFPQISAPSSATSANPKSIPNVATTFSFAIRPVDWLQLPSSSRPCFCPSKRCENPCDCGTDLCRIHSAWAASIQHPQVHRNFRIPKPASVHPKFIKNHKMMVERRDDCTSFLMKDQPRSHILLRIRCQLSASDMPEAP